MNLFSWFRRSDKPVRRAAAPRPRSTFRPSFAALEDRIVPFAPLITSIWSAAKLQVTAPAQVQPGTPFAVTVQALTVLNRTPAAYVGTVHFSLSNADPQAVLPADYTFKTTDLGTKTFYVTLGTSGRQTINVFDVAAPTLSASAATVVKAPAATHFGITLSNQVAFGQPTLATIVALDANNKTVPSYTGTVTFTSTDLGSYLPANYTFQTTDLGQKTFQVNFRTLGSQTLTVTDVANSSVTSTATTTVNQTSAVAGFVIVANGFGMSGAPTSFAVLAVDGYGQVVSNYVGTVHFLSTDPMAKLPADYTFTAADRGVHFFTATFTTGGMQMLAVRDVSSAAIVGLYDIYIITAINGTSIARPSWWPAYYV